MVSPRPRWRITYSNAWRSVCTKFEPNWLNIEKVIEKRRFKSSRAAELNLDGNCGAPAARLKSGDKVSRDRGVITGALGFETKLSTAKSKKRK